MPDYQQEYTETSKRAEWAAYVLLFGLVIELVFAFLPDASVLAKQLSTIAADIFIVAGVWGEIYYGQKAREAGDHSIAETNLKISEANERTAKAALELVTVQKLAGPRWLDAGVLAQELSGKPKAPVEIWYLDGASEVWTFAFNLHVGLLTAGWNVSHPVPIPAPDPAHSKTLAQMGAPRAMVAGGGPSGLAVVAPDGEPFDPTSPYRILFEALGKSTDRGVEGRQSQFMPVPKGTLRIVVTAKPDPVFSLPEWMKPTET